MNLFATYPNLRERNRAVALRRDDVRRRDRIQMAGESRGSADDGGEGIGGGWAENRGERRGETAGGYRFTRRPCFANRDGGRRLQRRPAGFGRNGEEKRRWRWPTAVAVRTDGAADCGWLRQDGKKNRENGWAAARVPEGEEKKNERGVVCAREREINFFFFSFYLN